MNVFQLFPGRLFFYLLLKAIAVSLVILFAGVALGPDEAQYWSWSRLPDWGYYSKPPGIAWQIKAGTFLFGETEWAVRFPSVLLSFLQAFAVYYLAIGAGLARRSAVWSGLFMAFSPQGILGSFFAVTDVGLVFCWTVACILLTRALHKGKEPSSVSIGIPVLVGGLFKWHIYLFWIYYLVCRNRYFPEQKISTALRGAVFSLIGLFPAIWWNFFHEGATFRHVWATLRGGSVYRSAGNFWEFFGSQALLVSPILFALLLLSLYRWFREIRSLSPPLFFFGLMTSSLMLSGMAFSLFQKVQGNWIAFAYPTAFVLIAYYMVERKGSKPIVIKAGVGLSVALTSIVLTIPSLYPEPFFSPFSLDYKLNPLKHNSGWRSLPLVLKSVGYDPAVHFLVSDKYQMSSILHFYSEGQKRTYFLNLQGMRKNQFSYWPSLQEEQKNKTGFFIWTENKPHLEREWKLKYGFYLKELEKFFESVEFKGMFPLIYDGESVAKAAFIFRCENCKNTKEKEIDLF